MFRKNLILLFAFFVASVAAQPIKVACVGSGMTYGETVANREKNSYPAQLNNFLGDAYQVVNFGATGVTAIKTSNYPYTSTKEYAASLEFNPDIVIIELGNNDSKSSNRKLMRERYKSDYQALINTYKALPSKPRIILMLPVRCYAPDAEYMGINEVYMNEIIPAIEALAYENSIEIIDLFNIFGEKWAFYQMPDKLHPSSLGATMLVERIAPAITFQSEQFSLPLPAKAKFNFYGYNGHDMGSVRIEEPKRVAVGRPAVIYVRRSDPDTDVALLEKGVYVVHCDEKAAETVRGFLDEIGIDPQASIAAPTATITEMLKAAGQWQNPCVKAVPGSEFRSTVGWKEGADWNMVSDEISGILQSKKVDLLLVGNSITQGFGGSRELVTHKPGKAAMDSVSSSWESAGIAGDHTQHVLWRLQNGGYAACDPRVVVVTIGVNNIYSGLSSEDAAQGVIAVLEEAARQFPNAKIYTFGLLPVKIDPTDPIRIKHNEVHETLAKTTLPSNVTYENLTSNFTNEDGTLKTELYASDNIHLSKAGYEMWAKVIARLL